MKRQFAIWTVLAFLWTLPAAAQTILVGEGAFRDESRNRRIPYLVYYPDPLRGRHPVILFSHGLGGSRQGGAYLGRHLASRGYVCFHIQHAGSDESLWKGKTRQRASIMRTLEGSLADPRNALNRFEDVPFVLDQLEKLEKEGPLFKGRLDLGKIGMAGHSYGGRSTMIAAGERVGRRYLSFKDSRIRAGLVLSPNLPNSRVDLQRAYRDIDIPLFHITGTEDASPLPSSRGMDPKRRTEPYRRIRTGAPQYLLVLQGADHMTFSGRRLGTAAETRHDARHIQVVLSGATAFFDAYLKGDRVALERLRSQYPKSLEQGDLFEWKPE